MEHKQEMIDNLEGANGAFLITLYDSSFSVANEFDEDQMIQVFANMLSGDVDFKRMIDEAINQIN